MMQIIYRIIIAVLLVLVLLMTIKIIKARTTYDRMNGLAVISTYVLILVIVYGFLDGRPEMYIDIAIAYAILGFVTNIVVAKYLGTRKKRKEK